MKKLIPGQKVKDKVTGVEGIIIKELEFIPDTYFIKPKKAKSDEMFRMERHRLIIIN